MRISPIHRPVLVALVLAAAGCSAGRVGGPAVHAEGEVRRAALARIVVENRTDRSLAIAFRSTAEPGREVVVGGVAANGEATVAPVLAGEPIVLLARADDGAELRLAARSFEIDAEWVWVIPADAAFGLPPTPDPRP